MYFARVYMSVRAAEYSQRPGCRPTARVILITLEIYMVASILAAANDELMGRGVRWALAIGHAFPCDMQEYHTARIPSLNYFKQSQTTTAFFTRKLKRGSTIKQSQTTHAWAKRRDIRRLIRPPFYYNEFPMQDEGRSKLKERQKQKQLLAWFTYERMRLSTTYDDRLGGFKSGHLCLYF